MHEHPNSLLKVGCLLFIVGGLASALVTLAGLLLSVGSMMDSELYPYVEMCIRDSLHKGPLDGGQAPICVLEALHGEDALTLGPHAQVDAGVDGRAVHQDGAGPALPHLAALLHAGEAQPLPQHVGQGLPGVDTHLHRLVVHGTAQHFDHTSAPVSYTHLSLQGEGAH